MIIKEAKKNHGYTLIGVCMFFVLSSKIFSQDIHFSQFDQAPLWNNPAETGNFIGSARFMGSQRTQWRSVTAAYQTFALSAEMKAVKQSPWSVAVLVGNDIAGDSQFRTTQLQTQTSFEKKVKGDSLVFIPGISLGITSRGFDPSALVYDAQWNGLVFDPSLPNQEVFARYNRTYLTVALGMQAKGIWNEMNWQGGIALNNLSRIKQSFFNDDEILLDKRLALNFRIRKNLNNLLSGEIISLYQKQGKMNEFVFGGRAYYSFGTEVWQSRAVFLGLHRRSKDALWLDCGAQYDQWRFGISYDINTSKLRPASAAKGGMEVSLSYIIPPKPKLGKLKEICDPFF
jgi:type IX secretion system PorP/SprF family membrane protein